MDILMRPIAITDVETTGLEPNNHEIIDVGLVVLDQNTLDVIHVFESKVKPHHPETGTKEAFAINGYDESQWREAPELVDVMKFYSRLTKDAIFAAHNMTFDWSFIKDEFQATGVENSMDYHRIDLVTMALEILRYSGLQRFNMNEVAKFLGITPEPMPHTGINGAMTEYEIYKRLRLIQSIPKSSFPSLPLTLENRQSQDFWDHLMRHYRSIFSSTKK